LIIDSSYVVKGIRRGPHFKHAVNSYQWRDFWEAAGDRTVTAVKTKSHVSAQEAEAAGTPAQHWFANQQADHFAEQAARDAQLPEDHLAAIHSVDKLAREVQEHLSAVALAVAQDSRGLLRPELQAPARSRCAPTGGRQSREAGSYLGSDVARLVQEEQPVPGLF
jgi:hypothetical protein